MLTVDDLPREPFSLADAHELGIARSALDRAVRCGVVRRVLRGAYVRADVEDTIECRARAAGLVLSRHAVLVDRTAAWVHGIDVLGMHEKEVLPPVESFVLRGHGRPQRRGVFGGVRDLAPQDVERVGGVAVTTALRTVLDLACVLPPRDALAAIDQFLHACLVQKTDLRRLLARYVRRRGVVQARWLVEQADARAESVPESWARYEILQRGLPTPVPQHWVEVDGVPTYRLDLAYPLHRIAIECDGVEFHSRPEDRERDRRRRQWLRDQGWIVIVLDRTSFGSGAEDVWIRQVREALRSRRSASARVRARNWRLDTARADHSTPRTNFSAVRN